MTSESEKVIERAERLLGEQLTVMREYSRSKLHTVARALHAQGLLASDLHVRALTACERFHEDYEKELMTRKDAGDAVRKVGREALARKEVRKPREKWEARRRQGCTHMFDVHGMGFNGFAHSHGPFTGSQARSVAAALNR